MYRSIDSAASFPAPIAPITVPEPTTASPPLKIPGTLVSRVTGSIFTKPLLVRSILSPSSKKSTSWPIPKIKESTSIVNSEPSIGVTERLPLLSVSPSFIFIQSNDFNLPFSPLIFIGAAK